MLNIVIFGAPGSGKGTQSENCREVRYQPHFHRRRAPREIKNGTELGKTAKGYIDQGQLLPDNDYRHPASTLDSFKGIAKALFSMVSPYYRTGQRHWRRCAERGQSVNVMLDLDVPWRRTDETPHQARTTNQAVPTTTKRLSRNVLPYIIHRQLLAIDWYKNEKL